MFTQGLDFKTTDLDTFPFPFTSDNYRYSNDLKRLQNLNCIEVTPEYELQVRTKRRLLDEQPEVRFQQLENTHYMQWEVLEMLVDMAVERYPEHFDVDKDGNNWIFRNNIFGEEFTFVFGDSSTIPQAPLNFIGRHFHNDFVMMVHRDKNFFLEVGQVSYAALFSANWNAGMSFDEIHAPVPFVSRKGDQLVERIRKFLLAIEPGEPWTRINWNLMADRWDVNYETMDIWEPQRNLITSENAGELVRLRVEEQKFYRMPRSNSILFVLNTQFLPLEDLKLRQEWFDLTYSVLQDIPPAMAEYKGIAPFLSQSIEYLRREAERIKKDM
ncbi:heme-dependent oxidative N-demethylase family protein [Solibacillus sp. FSL H8-0538]|uniref:heme-dependent oxidative N-demethylase family protein n=1 Tax=Solibacillus sp. FSL H8-0538 TaxID=2921400 RepID=UPI0030FA0431